MIPETDGPARPLAIAGREEGVIHTGSDDLDPPRRHPVQPGELLGLLGAAHADGVGAADHVHLGPLPPGRLPVAPFGLHPRQGVEGADQGQAELVLHPVAGYARQPVVGVDEVDAAVAIEVVHHALGELVDDSRERLFGQIGRAGVDVHHPEAGLDGHLVGQVVAPAPDVRGAVDAGLGQRRHQLAHVHVHATAVAGARLHQGRRVEGEHRQPAHGEVQLSSVPGDSVSPAPLSRTRRASTEAAPVR